MDNKVRASMMTMERFTLSEAKRYLRYGFQLQVRLAIVLAARP